MKSLGLFILMSFGWLYTAGQNTTNFRQPANEKVVPVVVKATFKGQYPNATVTNWYVTHIIYWYDDYNPLWYGNWYGPREVMVYTFEQPAYYEVEFMRDTETSRAIYNRYGYWYETRTQLRGLPLALMEKLKETKYAEWKWSTHKERLEAPGMPGSIYRLRVSKGIQSHIIRLDQDGNIIQIKQRKQVPPPDKQ